MSHFPSSSEGPKRAVKVAWSSPEAQAHDVQLWEDTQKWNDAIVWNTAAGVYWPGTTGTVNGKVCGGTLPDCYILQRESKGDPTAQNPTSTASGLWQDLDSTWGGYDGFVHAKDAPAGTQNARNAEVWAGGAGASNWACC